MNTVLNQRITAVLAQFGLSKIQTDLYITSLKHGTLSVLELSKLINVSRQKIYEEAEKLVDIGLYEITRKQRRKYIPAKPATLLALGEKRIRNTEKLLTEVSSLLPQLECASAPKKLGITLKYFEGLPKLREAYGKELEASKKTEVLSFAGSIEDIFAFFPETYWNAWNKRFVKQGSRSRMLVHNSPSAKETAQDDKKYARETRWLKNFPLKANIDVFHNTVLIVSPYDETAIWIESRILAESYRIMFNVLWANARSFS